jgi:hypothetical protein
MKTNWYSKKIITDLNNYNKFGEKYNYFEKNKNLDLEISKDKVNGNTSTSNIYIITLLLFYFIGLSYNNSKK